MNNTLTMSKTTLVFDLDTSKSTKSIDRLELTNVDSVKRVGYKIKSTNVSRYIVNPSSGIIDPLKSLKVDFMLTLQEGDNLSNINDKFRLYCLPINDETVTKHNIDHYIRKNEQFIKKTTIDMKIAPKQESDNKKAEANLSERQVNAPVQVMDNRSPDEVVSASDLFESIKLPIRPTQLRESEVTNFATSQSGLETLLIDKESEILKLKESNTMLQKDMSSLKEHILPEQAQKSIIKHGNIELWRFLIVFLLGILLGVWLNSGNSQRLKSE